MESTTTYDVIGIGNAIVDVLAKTEEEFLQRFDMVKHTMALIDQDRAELLYDAMPPATQLSGGSAANTIAGIASFGGKVAFIGKVKNDQFGDIFRHDMHSLGVHFDTPANESGSATARSFVFVTPDAARTMNTYLGACREIAPEDIDEEAVAASRICYLEGYLWDDPIACNAIRKAMRIAKEHNRLIAFSLSDPFCVDRHRAEFLELVTNNVDILFSNEMEITSLFQVDDFNIALENVRNLCEIGVLTRGDKGSVIVTKKNTFPIAAGKELDIVDTTGAGDLYAAGFLYGYTHGYDLQQCGKLGTLAANEVIQHIGARPDGELSQLLKYAISV